MNPTDSTSTNPSRPDGSLFVSGRLCLFGEHSDWASQYGLHAGYCIVVGTDQGLRARATQDSKFVIETQVPDPAGRPSGRSRQMACELSPEALLAAAQDEYEFFRYCAGTAHEMMPLPGVSGGVHISIDRMDLPLQKGVSSSAAVCILTAKAFDQVYRLGLFPHELMDMAYRGETLTGSQCGRMDQACIYGKTPVLLSFDRGREPRVEPLAPGETIWMFFVDLAGRKNTVRILADLQAAYMKSKPLQQALGAANERMVRQACAALQRGEAETLGRLMREAQAVFDRDVAPHSPDELASPLLHELLALEAIAPHIWGGKGVGSQGDGTAQFVARSAADRDAAMAAIAAAFPQMQCFPLTIGG